MAFKNFWKESLVVFFLKNILLSIVLIIALGWGTLLWIDHYTHHGEAEIVPDLKGLNIEEAKLMLSNHQLYPRVIDSVYVNDKPLGTIIDQVPAANSTVKQNRPIYIIINSRVVLQVPLPNVNDVSYRQANATLKSIGLNVSNVEYTPSEYKDLVIAVKYQGVSVPAGTRIPDGSSVVLVVGSGMGTSQSVAPDLKGLSLAQAQQALAADSMSIGAVQYDVQPSGGDSTSYFIYRQKPSAGDAMNSSSSIDVWLTKDKSLLNKVDDKDKQQNDDEEFF